VLSCRILLALITVMAAASVAGPRPAASSGAAPPSPQPPHAQGQNLGARLERILAAGVLRVCIWPDYYAITFRNPKNGALSGLDHALSAAFAADLGVAVDYVDSSFPAFVEDLLTDRCDVAMFGVGILPERAARVRFTQPYLRSDIWAVTTRTHPTVRSWSDIDRPGRVVAVQQGTFMEPVMKATLRHAELVSISPPATRERELRAGRVDVFLTDYPYSRRVIDNAPWATVMPPEQPIHPVSYAYAVAPGDDAWLERVDGFVADIKRDGRLREAARANRLEPIIVTQ
jgi:cyclohexadienyl dehydratase